MRACCRAVVLALIFGEGGGVVFIYVFYNPSINNRFSTTALAGCVAEWWRFLSNLLAPYCYYSKCVKMPFQHESVDEIPSGLCFLASGEYFHYFVCSLLDFHHGRTLKKNMQQQTRKKAVTLIFIKKLNRSCSVVWRRMLKSLFLPR